MGLSARLASCAEPGPPAPGVGLRDVDLSLSGRRVFAGLCLDVAADPALARFVGALERAVTWTVNHPDEAWELFRASDPDALDDELNRRAWTATLPRFALRPGALDVRRYERFGRWMLGRGLIEDAPAVDTYAFEVAAE